MVSAIVSLVIGIYEDPATGWIEGVAILSAVLIVAVVTACNDSASQDQFRKLNKQEKNIKVKVLRNGSPQEVDTNSLVVGDIVTLETGDKIPADIVVLSADSLTVNESSLTGEGDDKKKDTGVDPFLFSGCNVKSGAGKGLVYLVGVHSQWGKLKASIEKGEGSKTPLQIKLDDMANAIGNLGTVSAILTFIASLGVWYMSTGGGLNAAGEIDWEGGFKAALNAFIMGVTIVVVAVPEGLPLAVTISLAYSTQQMLSDNNLVRRLAACETMGNATTVCSDKTGTLTQNLMTVEVAYKPTGVELRRGGSQEAFGRDIGDDAFDYVSWGIALNTTAELSIPAKLAGNGGTLLDSIWSGVQPDVIGNKTEGALLILLSKLQRPNPACDYQQLRVGASSAGTVVARRTFNSKNKFMSVLLKDPTQDIFFVYTKG